MSTAIDHVLSRRAARAGFTVLEMMIALVIVALIGINISMVMRTSSSAYETGMIDSELDDRASLTLDRIRLALMSSSIDGLTPELTQGLHSSYVKYRLSLGLNADGELVLDDPEQITLREELGHIVWEKELAGKSRVVVWTKDVRPYFRDELPNGADDNDNGLVDERGLVFEKFGRNVRVQLTLERLDSSGASISQERQLTVTCRN